VFDILFCECLTEGAGAAGSWTLWDTLWHWSAFIKPGLKAAQTEVQNLLQSFVI